MGASPQRKFANFLAIASIAIPLLIMIWDIQVGAVSLLVGVVIAYRAIKFREQDDNDLVSDSVKSHQGERGRTIYVQIVDDYGRDLPPAEAQKLIADAQARANPRDMVVGVRHKIE